MGVQFCEDCGYLLPMSAADQIPCPPCGKIATNALLAQTHVSSSTNFPSRLRDRLRSKIQTVSQTDIGEGPIIAVECPKCLNGKASWTEAQLRSADEGSTIFYCCLQCRHRWQENN